MGASASTQPRSRVVLASCPLNYKDQAEKTLEKAERRGQFAKSCVVSGVAPTPSNQRTMEFLFDLKGKDGKGMINCRGDTEAWQTQWRDKREGVVRDAKREARGTNSPVTDYVITIRDEKKIGAGCAYERNQLQKTHLDTGGNVKRMDLTPSEYQKFMRNKMRN